MSKPDWCPPDVWDAARRYMEPVTMSLPPEEDQQIVECCARAIMAEREKILIFLQRNIYENKFKGFAGDLLMEISDLDASIAAIREGGAA